MLEELTIEEFLTETEAKLGVLPVVVVTEVLEEFNDTAEFADEAYSTSSEVFVIDLEKLDDMFDFRYVKHILNAAVNGQTNYSASLKYSFSDTPDWWADYTADKTEGRKVLHIDVKLNF